MVDIGIGQKNACNPAVAEWSGAWLQSRRAFDLPRQIRRRIDQPRAVRFFRVGANRDARLRLRFNFSRTRRGAVGTRTIPLRQGAAGSAAENMDPNQPKLSR